jgi:hypothetical protein
VISFGQGELTTMTASVAGGMIGFYQMGYGIAAFGVGPLQSWAGLTLPAIYRGTALVALALAALAFVIVGGRKTASEMEVGEAPTGRPNPSSGQRPG